MVCLPQTATFLCIGCGSFPWTLLALGSATQWSCMGIDCDTDAVISARRLVQSYQLQDSITILHADARHFDMSAFDIISISFGVSPKQDILEHIVDSAKKNAHIILRSTWEVFHLVYGSEVIPPKYQIRDVYYRIDGIKTYLLHIDTKDK